MFIPENSQLNAIVDKADQYAKSNLPVFILGESGVGKELIARRIHTSSLRKGQPFIALNCSTLPQTLLESELFGHEKGSFSGAMLPSKGLVRAANRGTLFLDEVGEIEITSQAKLLRLIDQGEIRSVGSQKVEWMDVRIVAATNILFPDSIQNKKFRLDLFERLSVLTLFIPPLRERKNEIIPFAKEFLKNSDALAEEGALECLKEQEWPGNLRQLKNFIAKAVILGGQIISKKIVWELLQEELALHPVENGSRFVEKLEDLEKNFILRSLQKYKGNRKVAARELGIAKSTLHEKLKRWKNEGFDAPGMVHPRQIK